MTKKNYLKPELEIEKFEFQADMLYLASTTEQTIPTPGPSQIYTDPPVPTRPR